MPLTRLSDCELDVIKILWDQDYPVSQAQIKEELEKRKGRAYGRTTIATWLTRLGKKKLLTVTTEDGLLHYKAAISRSDYEKMEVRLLADRLYRGSVPGIVAAMAEKEILTKDEEVELRGILDRWNRPVSG